MRSAGICFFGGSEIFQQLAPVHSQEGIILLSFMYYLIVSLKQFCIEETVWLYEKRLISKPLQPLQFLRHRIPAASCCPMLRPLLLGITPAVDMSR